MKEILIFEDGENTPSSRLLKASFNGDNIYFSERCTNMKDTLDKLYNNTDRFWLFYDVPPNNEIAVNSYMSLCQELYSYKRVCVIPIICIEYYIIRMFAEYNYANLQNDVVGLVDNLVLDFNNSGIQEMDKIKSNKVKGSIERVYKYILDKQKLKCMLNHNKYDKLHNIIESDITGKFYKIDCNCKFCKINCKDKLSLKAERLYTSLPIFDASNEDYKKILKDFKIYVKDVTAEEVLNKCQKIFDKLCDILNVNHIRILKFKVDDVIE